MENILNGQTNLHLLRKYKGDVRYIPKPNPPTLNPFHPQTILTPVTPLRRRRAATRRLLLPGTSSAVYPISGLPAPTLYSAFIIENMSSMEGVQHLKISLESIKIATNNFSDENFIARGGFGKVYRGHLSFPDPEHRRSVAVKRLDRTQSQGIREFLMEIQMLSCYQHKHLISLVGFCDESDEMILIYEYASRGSLDNYIRSPDLSWDQRLKISLGAARGFSYLHHDVGSQHRVIHRDIKSSNILLDENWEAKVSDLGLSKIGPSNMVHTFLVTNVCGTYGYVDPEYVHTGILTKESDVYSFGVVLFEILCGRPAWVGSFEDERKFLASLAQRCYEDKKLDDIICPELRKQMKPTSMDAFSTIAYDCLNKNRRERPTMSQIVEKLENALRLQDGTPILRLEYRTTEKPVSQIGALMLQSENRKTENRYQKRRDLPKLRF